MEIASSVAFFILQTFVFIYDIISLPIYAILYAPRSRKRANNAAKSEAINHEGGITFRSVIPMRKTHIEIKSEKLDTMDKLFTYAIKKNGSKKCLGTREVIDEEDELQSDGKLFKKYVLGDYKWDSYNEVNQLATSLCKGLAEIGLKPKDRVCIFAETRAEWYLTAIAAFRMNLTIVTLYATLGDEAITHGINETEVKHIITSYELLPKFKSILPNTPIVESIVYMEDPLKKAELTGFKEGVHIQSFCDLIALGRRSAHGTSSPSPDDIAIIMYTSGSTGTPKGVLLTHRNILASMLAYSDALGEIYETDVYIGYFPLAHVLELMCETICFVSGVPIGYSSPLTMTDMSSKIKHGSKGDASILKPTLMAVVPLILDRIFKGIQEKLVTGSSVSQKAFKYFYNYKLKWYARGFDTPIVNRIIFSKIRNLVGGNVRIMASGGAPLSPDTHEFVRTSLCCPLIQGYGLTETTGCAAVMLQSDMTTGRVGGPLPCNDMRLINWEEGNYRYTDKPYPRGEIVIGGESVSIGYFKLPDATKEEFVDFDGRRWFKTGDIGEVHSDGAFKIIDRKKDLVKLQQGEYISLGKVEAEMKTCPLVENICIYGDSSKLFTVALLFPVVRQLEILAHKLGKNGLSFDFEILCKDPDIEKAVLKELQQHGTRTKLQKFELPGAVKLCPELWTPDSGLVTATFKLKRKVIQERYQAEIDEMYSESS